MKTSTKNTIVAGLFTICGSLIGALCTESIISNKYKQQNFEIENNIINSGIEINIDESMVIIVNQLISEYDNLRNEVTCLSNENSELLLENNNLKGENEEVINENIKLQKQNLELETQNETLLIRIAELDSDNRILDSKENAEDEMNQKQNIVYLNNLPVFNCQYYDRGTWAATSLYEWSSTDKAADGNKYKNATHMAIHGNWSGFAQIIVIDYLLGKNYKILNGNFMLDELSKSTTSIAILNIYGDDELIYTFDGITGGLVPQNTDDISVENVNKLRFEFVSEQGELGNYDHHFGVVFYDTILK